MRSVAQYGWQAPALILVLLAVIGMGGCGMGTTELPGATQPGGPGFLSIITQKLNDGVQGVSYLTTLNTSGGSGRLTLCRVVSGTLPSGISFPIVSGSTCILTTNGTAVTGAPGKYTFSLEAGDSSTPQRTDQRVYSLTIRPHFTVNPPVILDAVSGRSYTRTFTVTTNLQNHAGPPLLSSSEAGNGPITRCAISGLPGGFAAGGGTAGCVIGGAGVNVTVTMKAPPGTLTAGVYPFTLSVTDSPIRSTNQTGVVAPASTETITPNLIVRQEFAVTQGTIAEAVQGRTYGAAPLAQGVQTSVLGIAPAVSSGQPNELGNGPLTNCSLSVSPSDAGISVAVDPKNPSRCLLVSTAAAPAAGTYIVTVSATDSPILDPALPGVAVVPANTQRQQLMWRVAPPLSYSLNFDNSAGQPGQVPDAVENRTYGGPPKSSLIVTAAGGLSSTTGLSITMGGTIPAGVLCSPPVPNPQPPGQTAEIVCSSGGNPVTAAPGAANFTVLVSDSGNQATPAGSTSSDANGHSSHTLTVDPPLSLGVNLTDPLPSGVSGRSYGLHPAQPVLYSASGGLGAYSFATPATLASPGAAFPQGIACAQGSGTTANTLACSAVSITANGSATASYGPVPVTVDDTSNATTPDGKSSGTAATQNRTLAVEPPLSITPVAGIDPPPQGVQGRTYGTGSGFVPLAYVISGGDPPYTNFTFPNSIASSGGGLPAPIACQKVTSGSTPSTTEVVCSSNGANVSANPGVYTFQFSVSDTGSGETAASSITLAPRTITINAPLAWNGANPTSNAPPPGVQHRTYGGTGFVPLTYNATGGIGAYSFTLPPQSVSPGSNALPAGVDCAASSGTQVVCSSGASPVSAASGSYSFSIAVNDTADATTPGSQTSSTGATVTKSLAIEPPLAFSPASQTLVSAVIGRAYGEGSGCSGGNCQPFDYTLSGGLGGYQPTINPGNGITCTLQSNGTSYQCASASIPGPAGTPVLNITATDTGNAATPSGTVSSTAATATATLPINAAMTITPPTGTLPPAVTGRTYGSGAGCSGSGGACQAIVFSVAGGLGGYSASPTLSGFPGAFACPFASTGSLSGTYSCFTASGVSGASPATLSISATDTANTSTPTAQASSNPVALTIFPEITVSGPTTALPDAVAARTYGFGSTCGAGSNVNCQPITYNVNGGLGGYSSPPTLDGYPAGLSCQAPVNGSGSVPSASYTCLSTGGVSVPGSYTVGISVTDTANASTPAISTAKASNTTSLRVDQALALALSSGPPPNAVDLRGYGTGTGCTGSGGACVPVAYTISNGLGAYAIPASLATSYGFSCALPNSASSVYQCSASTISVTLAPPATPTPEILAVTASDIANAATPAGPVTNNSASVTVYPSFTLKAVTTSPATAVVGRSYGTGSTCGAGSNAACQSINYNVTGGFGSYQPTASLTTASASLGSLGIICTLNGGHTQYNCLSSGVTTSPAITVSTSTVLTVTATDSGNGSAPAATASDNSVGLMVNPEMTLVSSPASWPDGVTGRNYAVTGNTCGALGNGPCANLTITASGGLGTPYVFPGSTPASFPAGFSCSGSGSAYTCNASPVTASNGSFSPSVIIKDNANASTPPSSQTFAGNVKIDSALSLTSTALTPDALLEYPYSSIALQAADGLGGYTWVEPGATSGACQTAPTGNLPGGLSINAGSGVLSGTPTSASNPSNGDSDFTFQVCVTDTGNSTTPRGSALPQTTGNDFTVNVFNRFAYIADTAADEVRVIDTGESAKPPSIPTPAPVVSISPANLQGAVAVTPDGRYAFALLTGTSGFAVIDTITNAAVPKSPFAFPSGATCTSPVGVAFSSNSTKAYFACGGNSEIVEVDISQIAGSSGTVTAVASSTATTGTPAAVALSPDGASLCVITSTPQLLIYNAASLATAPKAVPLSSGVTPVAIALAANGSNVYAYVAETKSGSPGQVEVFNVPSGTTVTGSPIVFSAAGSPAVNPEPTSIAVTPDTGNSRVYVGLADTDQFALISNGVAPALVGQYNLPDPSKKASSSPAGIAIPPLSTIPSTGYRIFFTSINGGKGEVDIIDDNKGGAPSADLTTLTSFGSSSTPVGVVNIPLPVAP